jgi:hypothetical protein
MVHARMLDHIISPTCVHGVGKWGATGMLRVKYPPSDAWVYHDVCRGIQIRSVTFNILTLITAFSACKIVTY